MIPLHSASTCDGFYNGSSPILNPVIPFLIVGGALVLGLLVGSFLNVCIARIPRGESIVNPRSHCMACGHPVRWYDNMPILSWLILRGRCRDCGTRISWQYPAVELAFALWLVLPARLCISGYLAYVQFGQPLQDTLLAAVTLAILGFLLIGLIVMDWQTHRLPDAFTLTGIAIGLSLVCLQAIFLGPHDDQIVLNSAKQLRLSSPGSFAARGNVFLTGPEALIFGRLAAVAGAALILLLIRWGYKALRKRDGLGLGDVKMLAMVAAFLGFWPAVLTLFFGVMLGAVYGVTLVVRGRATARTRLPLGSFLGLAGLFAALFGDSVLAWYRTLL